MARDLIVDLRSQILCPTYGVGIKWFSLVALGCNGSFSSLFDKLFDCFSFITLEITALALLPAQTIYCFVGLCLL